MPTSLEMPPVARWGRDLGANALSPPLISRGYAPQEVAPCRGGWPRGLLRRHRALSLSRSR